MSRRFHDAWRSVPMHRLSALLASITLLACGDDPVGTPFSPTPVGPAVSVTIYPAELNLIEGEERTFIGRAADSRGRTASVSFAWSSDDPDIATAGESDGTVTAIAAGTTRVNVSAGSLRASAKVTVWPPGPARLSISTPALGLIVGGAQQLTAAAYDALDRTTNASFEWSSADPAIATVGPNDGTITAMSPGVTTVTVAVGTLRATATVSVITLDGSFAFTRMTVSSDGQWSSDVLFISADDRTIRSLPRPEQFASVAAPAWSPDGMQLAVEVIHSFTFDEWLSYSSDVYVLDATAPGTSPWRALTTNGFSTSPTWSPDGTRIAYLQQQEMYSSANGIFIVDAMGGTAVRLTQTAGYYSRPRWSPDGTRLAFSFVGAGSSRWEIVIVNADGSGLTRVAQTSASDVDPSWSPDGTQLAFVSSRGTSAQHFSLDVFVVGVDGGNLRRLTSMPEYCLAPSWSPDGRQILFSSGAALYVMNLDGSSPVRLTTPPQNSWDTVPVWR